MQFNIFLFFLAAYGATAEDACPSTEIMKLAKLYANPNLHECQKVSADFSIASLTDPQIKAMCASDPCRKLIKDVLALKPADCYLSFDKMKVNAYKVASSIDDTCMTDMTEDNDSWKSPPPPKYVDDKQYRHKQEEQKYVKDANGTYVVKIDDAQDADAINSTAINSTAINSTAIELSSMPATTLPANV